MNRSAHANSLGCRPVPATSRHGGTARIRRRPELVSISAMFYDDSSHREDESRIDSTRSGLGRIAQRPAADGLAQADAYGGGAQVVPSWRRPLVFSRSHPERVKNWPRAACHPVLAPVTGVQDGSLPPTAVTLGERVMARRRNAVRRGAAAARKREARRPDGREATMLSSRPAHQLRNLRSDQRWCIGTECDVVAKSSRPDDESRRGRLSNLPDGISAAR